ncbi:putative transcriptional regulator [Phycicoccus elongatus Lp2]|uniref:Putative transcriptional regulator n=1 Tax=Phycicoccus elongatus Lp2 TaxID=1193181 RepID=N0E4C4_9MICO|nr:YafY family protein [Phycicoccus elongatus]CCH70670.1 putative transcriptional regulator [Phycicoccus elongatus Lp2]
MRADRLIDLVTLLRRHERLSATDLARRLGVSKRTVLRDLDDLSASGVPVYAEHGRLGGFSLLPGYRPETAGLTEGESTVLFVPGGEPAADALGRGAEFRSARRKLEAVLSDNAARGVGDLADWLLIAPEGWGEPVEPPALLPRLAAACARHTVLDVEYRARGERGRLRRVRPLGLVLGGRTWYLVALKDDTGEQRTYRVDRVRAIADSGREFDPPGITLREAWERARTDMREQKDYRVILRATSDVAPIVSYVVSTVGRVTSMATLADGRQEITAHCDRLEAAAAMLAGVGERAEIVDPPALIEAVLDVSRHNLARYGGA